MIKSNYLEKSVENWLKIAKYDLDTAKVCLDSERFISCVEKCHNCLEKILKALLQAQKKTPAKVHDLLILCTNAVIENLQEETKEFLTDLDDLYIGTRYPEDFELMESKVSKEEANKIFKESKRIFKWLKEKIK